MYHAGIEFSGKEGVKVSQMGANGSHLDGIVFGDQLFVRFKKADSSLFSRNVATQAALDFHDQQIDLYGGISRSELIYSLSSFGQSIDRFVLIQRHKKSIVWQIELDGSSSAAQTVIPISPQAPLPGSPADRIIKTKKTDHEHQPNERGESGS